MKILFMLLVLVGFNFAQVYTNLFKSDLPSALNSSSTSLEIQLRTNLDLCKKVNPLIAGYYLEHLKVKFDGPNNNPRENYFIAYNSYLNSEREKRNRFIDEGAEKLYNFSRGDYTTYGAAIVSELKLESPTDDDGELLQVVEKNKLFYYGLKLLTEDIRMKYNPEVNYASQYATFFADKISFINSLPSDPGEISNADANKVHDFLKEYLYLVKGSGMETAGVKTGKDLFNLIRLAGEPSLRQQYSVFVFGNFIPISNEYEYSIEKLKEARGEQGNLYNEKDLVLEYSVSMGLGFRFPLRKYEGLFSYIDLYGGIISGIKNEIRETRNYVSDFDEPIDYSDYFYDEFDFDTYDLLENKKIKTTGYFFGLSTPLFTQDGFIDAGISLDVQFYSFEFEQTYQRNLVKVFPIKNVGFTDDHFSSISKNTIEFIPGAWVSFKFFDFIEIKTKYLAVTGLSAGIEAHYRF